MQWRHWTGGTLPLDGGTWLASCPCVHEWAPEPVWLLCRGENILLLMGIEPGHPVHWLDSFHVCYWLYHGKTWVVLRNRKGTLWRCDTGESKRCLWGLITSPLFLLSLRVSAFMITSVKLELYNTATNQNLVWDADIYIYIYMGSC
jgi:hypothetical protein